MKRCMPSPGEPAETVVVLVPLDVKDDRGEGKDKDGDENVHKQQEEEQYQPGSLLTSLSSAASLPSSAFVMVKDKDMTLFAAIKRRTEATKSIHVPMRYV